MHLETLMATILGLSEYGSCLKDFMEHGIGCCMSVYNSRCRVNTEGRHDIESSMMLF